MTFLNFVLLGGILAAGIPILIHLLNRRRFRVVKWGAMQFLDSAFTTHRRRLRLEQWILLLIRTLIPVLLAVCMARPVLTGVRSLVRKAMTSMVVVLDNSYSMEAGDSVQTSLQAALDAANRIVSFLPRGSEVAFTGMAAPVPQLGEPRYDLPGIRRDVSEVSGGFGRADAAGSIEQTAGLFGSRMHHADRELLIFSDFQKASWGREGAVDRMRAYELLQQQPVPPRTILFPAGPAVRENISVESLTLSRSLVGLNQQVLVRANVRNLGTKAYQDLRVYFRADGKEQSISQVSLAPGESSQVLFPHRFTEPGSHVLEVEAGTDRLKADNLGYASIPVLEHVDTLLISGDPNPEPLRAETAFLEIALQPNRYGEEAESDLIRTRTVSAERLSAQDLAEVRVVVLANVEQLKDPQLKLLEEFVQNGGGCLFFPGDRVNSSWYNSRLAGDGQGLIPCRLSSIAGGLQEEDQPAGLVARHFEHPALQLFNDPRQGHFQQGRIRLWYRLDIPDGFYREEANVNTLARLDTGDPFLVEKKFGEGRVLFCCAPCDADWSNFPLRPFYVPLMQELVTYLASSVYPPRNLEVGEMLAALVPLSDVSGKAAVVDPAGQRHERSITRQGLRGLVEFSDTQRPGLYLFHAPSGEITHYVVRTPVDESDLTRLGEEELQALATEMDAEVVRSWEEYRELDRRRRFGREIWKLLLWGVLIFLFTETLLTRLFTRRST